MQTIAPSESPALVREASSVQLASLLERIAELLPAQGPITAFVFLNTLQALEDLPFDVGVQKGAKLFGCRPYLTEERYREEMKRDRIRARDLDAVLHEDMGADAEQDVATLGTRFDLRSAMLKYPIRSGPAEELRWFIAETDALKRLRSEAPVGVREKFIESTRRWVMRDVIDVQDKSPEASDRHHGSRRITSDVLQRYQEAAIEQWDNETWEAAALHALWKVCREGVQRVGEPAAEPWQAIRHRDYLLETVNEDSDSLAHGILIRFCAAFTDQGFADWPLPQREQGFFHSFCTLYGGAGGPPDLWMQELPRELNRVRERGLTPLESIQESLDLLGVEPDQWEDYLTASLLALKGWCGLLWQMEVRGDRVAQPVPKGTLIEFMAIRLILDRIALGYLARTELGFEGSLRDLREFAAGKVRQRSVGGAEQRAFLVFQLAQVLNWPPQRLFELSTAEWTRLLEEIEAFGDLERRRILHHAFERRFRRQTLDAFSAHARPASRVARPIVQTVFCIDTREESFRRHQEELAPNSETFAAAGFFVIPMYYRGAADAHFSTLCPVVIRPQHWVVEDVVYSLEETHRRRAKTRKALGTASHQMHMGSRSLAQGALLTASFGVLASIPLVARVLFPRLTARIMRTAGKFVAPPPITRLRLERTAEQPGPEGEAIGFSVAEMANIAERMLRDIGLVENFSRLVIFFGHGSFCLNNPHKSAYDCGACSGSAGGPNARALAAMLNDPRIRKILSERGLEVPKDTYFIGGLHNTCADSLTYYDLDLLPKGHTEDFERAKELLEKTCERNAHERCRRFHSAPLNITPPQAHRHVEGRSEDLAQVRPEFGNASNAICYVGRRSRIRGLYLDRRCFMHSYDSTIDDDEVTILGRILGAAVVVCEGINLQYYFSYVDSPGWGSGTKLPHNVTSLLGVMDGYTSDLRTGLPLQGVEIHEAVRLLFVIETTPEAMFKIMNRNPLVGKILRNGWVQLSVIDPHSSKIQTFRNGEFHPYVPETNELPRASSSIDWYRGWRDHLGFAVIGDQ